MQFLFLGTTDLSVTVKMLKHDDITIVQNRLFGDELCRKDGNPVIDAISLRPEPRCF